MILLRTRLIVSAFVFTANAALSLSYGAAEAQAPHHGVRLASRQHTLQMEGPSSLSAESGPAIKRGVSIGADSDFSRFCGFSGPNAC
jgi:hypothetical protein